MAGTPGTKGAGIRYSKPHLESRRSTMLIYNGWLSDRVRVPLLLRACNTACMQAQQVTQHATQHVTQHVTQHASTSCKHSMLHSMPVQHASTACYTACKHSMLHSMQAQHVTQHVTQHASTACKHSMLHSMQAQHVTQHASTTVLSFHTIRNILRYLYGSTHPVSETPPCKLNVVEKTEGTCP